MKALRLSLFAALALFAVTAFAAGLSRYRGWENSPEGYFMTGTERSEWKTIRTDDDAAKFVDAFLARRGPAFRKDVAAATAAADKYFTVGGNPGSKTERGKLVILLGPPSSISMAERKVSGEVRNSPNMQVADSGGPSVGDIAAAAQSPGSGKGSVYDYTFTYTADKLPAAYGKALAAIVEVDGGGHDHITDRRTQVELARLYEMIVQAKATPPAAAPAP